MTFILILDRYLDIISTLLNFFFVFSANTTFTSSDIEDAINVQANKLLTDKLTQSSTKEDVQNFLALAICTTIVGVSSLVTYTYISYSFHFEKAVKLVIIFLHLRLKRKVI